MYQGLSNEEWKIFKNALPKEPDRRGRGMPHADFRCVLNTILFILTTGSRWKDVPKASCFASKSSSHRWLLRWKKDGTLNKILALIIRRAREADLIDGHRLLIDGSFSPWENGGKPL